MDLFVLLCIGFVLGITGAMIPGPLTLFTVSETLKSNKLSGLKAILGHIIIEFVIILAILLGFQTLLTSREFLLVMSIIGGLALVVMGVLLFWNAAKMKLSSIKNYPTSAKGLVLGGVFFSAVSPGFLVWWTSIGISTLARAFLFGTVGVIILMLGHWLADVLWYGFLSYATDKGKAYLSDKLYQNI